MLKRELLVPLTYASLLLGFLVMLGFPGEAMAQESSIVGIWKLVSVETIRPNGEILNQWKEQNPVGLVVYDSTGIMMVQFRRKVALKMDEGVHMEGIPEELRASYEGFYDYFGSYYVNEKEGFVVHRINYGLSPREEGTDYKRFFKCAGNCMTLTTPVFQWKGERQFNQITLEKTEK